MTAPATDVVVVVFVVVVVVVCCWVAVTLDASDKASLSSSTLLDMDALVFDDVDRLEFVPFSVAFGAGCVVGSSKSARLDVLDVMMVKFKSLGTSYPSRTFEVEVFFFKSVPIEFFGSVLRPCALLGAVVIWKESLSKVRAGNEDVVSSL
jgi:hypothetical protein